MTPKIKHSQPDTAPINFTLRNCNAYRGIILEITHFIKNINIVVAESQEIKLIMWQVYPKEWGVTATSLSKWNENWRINDRAKEEVVVGHLYISP